MKAYLLITCLIIGFINRGYGQVNVVLLHQLVSESQSEYDGQEKARNNQALSSAHEEVNKSEMSRLQTTYRKLQSRFLNASLAISSLSIGMEAIPVINEVIEQQSLIFQRTRDNPVLVVLALNAEADLAERAEDLLSYIFGLAASYGELNQMKPSDRKMLFEYVVTELRRIAGASRGLASTLYYASRNKGNSLNPFSGYINNDKQLVNEIIGRVKVLKPN